MPSDLNVVIAGGGRVGITTASLLADMGHDVTIIERDEQTCEAIADEWVATVIEGDATDPDVLEQTGLDRTDVVAALTGEMGLNLAVCMAASELAPHVRTVARIDRETGERYTRFVDEVVYPERAGARVASNEIVGSDVRTLSDVTGSLDIMEIRAEEGAPAVGKTLSDLRFPAGSLVISDDDGDRIARPDTVIEAGNHYVVAVEPSVVDEVLNLLRG
jgi:trk system potassium uptake protein TrkA